MRRSTQEFLRSAGLESYSDAFNSMGVHSVSDIRESALHTNDEALKSMGLKTVQISRLRHALMGSHVRRASNDDDTMDAESTQQSFSFRVRSRTKG
jgi:hypothetical protein